LAALAAFAPASARASPWPSSGQAISSVGIGEAAGVETIDLDDWRETPSPIDRLSLVTHTFTRLTPVGVETEISAASKLQIRSGPRWAAALEAGPTWLDRADSPCRGLGGEIRLGVGRSFGPGAAKSGYAAVEVAHSERTGCAELKADMSVGYRADEKWLFLAQSFARRSGHGNEALKVQISAVRFGARRAVQVGVRVRTDGDDREPALVIGLWRR